jgi:hypothetical protein
MKHRSHRDSNQESHGTELVDPITPEAKRRPDRAAVVAPYTAQSESRRLRFIRFRSARHGDFADTASTRATLPGPLANGGPLDPVPRLHF